LGDNTALAQRALDDCAWNSRALLGDFLADDDDVDRGRNPAQRSAQAHGLDRGALDVGFDNEEVEIAFRAGLPARASRRE
jgi:hypothetical protein